MLSYRYLIIILFFCFLLVTPSLVMSAPGWLKDACSQPLPEDLHEDATAVITSMTFDTKISGNGSAVTKVRRIIKIIGGGGSDYSGIVELKTEIRDVKGIKGWRIDQHGTDFSLKKENIFEIATDFYAGSYNDAKMVSASFPDVTPGDIIGYEYTIKEDKGSEGLYKKYNYPQGLPILESNITIDLPDDWSVQFYHQNMENIAYSNDEKGHVWKIGRQYYFPDEYYTPADATTDKYVFVNCHFARDSKKVQFSSWQSVAKWACDLYDTQYQPDNSITALALRLTAKATTTDEKIVAIANYVRDDIRYVAIELGDGRFQPRSAPETLANQYGDCKDKATIMKSLLKAVDIPSHTILVDLIDKIDTSITTPYQFNHVILAIPENVLVEKASYNPAIQDGWLYFDPTDQTSQVGYLPPTLYGNRCLHISEQVSQLYHMPEMKPGYYRRNYRANATLHDDNSLSAHVRVTDLNKRAGVLNYTFKNSGVEEFMKVWQRILSNSIQNLEISNFTTGAETDSAWFEFDVTGQKYLEVSGNLNILKADFIHADSKSELKKKAKRHYPISFGHAEIITTEIIWTLPEGWTVSDGLDSVSAECAIASVVSENKEVEGKYRFYTKRYYKGGQMEPSEYKAARSFDRKRSRVSSTKYFIVKP